jgi:hypothetical protein
MENVISGIALIALGVVLIILRKPLAEITIGFQIRVFHMPFGRREVKTSVIIAVLVGIVSIVDGILVLIGVLKVK